MKASPKRTCVIVLISFLTLGGLLSLYQTLFDLWMTAYPYADAGVWAGRLYLRLATTTGNCDFLDRARGLALEATAHQG